MLHFYNGFTDQLLEDMDCRDFAAYYNAMDLLMNREHFDRLIVSNYQTSSNKNDRNKLWKETRNRAFPPEKRISSEQEIQAFLGNVQGR